MTPISYARGLDKIIESGAVHPLGDAVIIRAILPHDVGNRILQPMQRASDAVCHEVIAVSEGAVAYWRAKGYHEEKMPKPGWHAYARSSAADAFSQDMSSRYWQVDAQYIKSAWDPKHPALVALAEEQERERRRQEAANVAHAQGEAG